MKRSVYEMLNNLRKESSISFHYPGHKGRFSNVDWNNDLLSIDTTEMIGTDNLQAPKEAIKDSMDEAARIFGTKATFYGVNGSTASIYAAIRAVVNSGDEILLQRNCHKSVFNAVVLNRLKPHYIFPAFNEQHRLITGIKPEDIDKALIENPKIKCVVLTNPNYFGVCLKLKEIVEIVHKHNKILIVDEAHGGHLFFKGENSALNYGADLVIHSTHKTFPSLTSTSLLHVKGDRVSVEKVRDALNLFTTTSPSYLFILSNESAIAYMDKIGRERILRNEKYIVDMANDLKSNTGIKIFSGDKSDPTIGGMDYSKILISIEGKEGNSILEELYYKHNIRLEMSDFYNALAVSTVMDEEEDFIKLKKALIEIDSSFENKEYKSFDYKVIEAKKIVEPFIAFESEKEVISLEKSVGRTSGTNLTPYPPGVPLITYGEEINAEIVSIIKKYLEIGIEVTGFIDDNLNIEVVREI